MKLRSFYRTYSSLAKSLGYVRVKNNGLNSDLKSLNSNSSQNSCSKYLLNTMRRLSSDISSTKCWKCNLPKKYNELFCTKCKALQELPDKNLNYFQLIGVDENYDLKINEVQNKYRQLQNLLHPDRFSNSTEREKELSENLSSLVNKAYGTLSHPLQRGLYMLKLNNVEIPEGTTSLNPGFLMEIMEKNEEVEAASKDADKVLNLVKENRKILEDYSRQVSAAFQQNDLQLAKKILVKMKYFASIEAKLKTLKQSLGIVE